MGRHLRPRYGQMILASGYPVLTSVDNMNVQYQIVGFHTS